MNDLLTLAQVIELACPPDRKLRPRQVYEWIRDGKRVRGTKRRVRLAATRTVCGVRVRRADLDAFLDELQGGRDVVGRAGVAGGYGPAPSPVVTRTFARCAEHEKGTYPGADECKIVDGCKTRDGYNITGGAAKRPRAG